MVSEIADRGRRGDQRYSIATRATGWARVALLCGAVLAATSVSAQDEQSGGAVRSQQQQMEQALRALARGLSERARELGQDLKDERDQAGTDALATGSIQAPFLRSWIAPVPLPQMSRFEAPSGRPAGRDVTRLFQPHPLGAPAALKRIWPGFRQETNAPVASLPAAPSSSAPPPPAASRSAQDLAALPEPRLPLPAPPAPFGPVVLPAAPAEPRTPSAAPVERQAAVSAPAIETPATTAPAGPRTDPQPRPSARDAARPSSERGRETIDAKEPDATPADRASSRGRLAARPAERPDREAEPPETDKKAGPARRAKPPSRLAARPAENRDSDDEPDAGEAEAKPARRAQPERARSAARQKPAPRATRDVARAPALVSPDVTSSIDRSSPSRLQVKASTARLTRNARRQVSDIPVIPLPDILRPTRPPAGSPL
jgi:hypothetical protein